MMSALVAIAVWNETPGRLGRSLLGFDTSPSEVEASVFYRRCAEAWAAGTAPLYEGEPGYREGLDGDSDGIACEPVRRP